MRISIAETWKACRQLMLKTTDSNNRHKIKPSPKELVDKREKDTMGNQFYYFQERDIGYHWLIWGR